MTKASSQQTHDRRPFGTEHRRWGTSLLVAVVLHGVLLSAPFSKSGGKHSDYNSIDVSVIGEPVPVEKPIKPPSLPVERQRIEKARGPAPARAEGRKTAELPQKVVSPEPGPEKEVVQAGPGSGGVAVVGVTGSGVTLSGASGKPGGSGAGLGHHGVGGGGGGTGPVDARFGSGDGPQWAYQEKPVYPYAAQRLGKRGRVVLRLTIDEKGNLTKTEVIEATDQIFVAAVLEAARRSRYSPARRNGIPFATRAIWPVTFSPGDRS